MKIEGFAERLGEFVHSRLDTPYAWGTNDCVVFAADAVQAITGEDPLGLLRGKWQDEATAIATIQANGGLIRAIDARFPRRPNPWMAQRGDICLLKVNGMPSIAICTGADCAAPTDDGLILLSLSEARIAWEV